MSIYLLAVLFAAGWTVGGLWAIHSLYGGQSEGGAAPRAPASTQPAHSVIVWVDDGGAYIDGEVLP